MSPRTARPLLARTRPALRRRPGRGRTVPTSPTPSAPSPATACPPVPRALDPRDEGEEGMYGPRGWTVSSGMWHELARCRDELRSTVIPERFGLGPAGLIGDDGVPQDDYTPFHDLGPDTACRLLEILPVEQLDDRQNLGPTLGALLTACLRAGGRVRLSGYAIGPQRRDERLSVEGLWIADEDLLEMEISEDHDEFCRCLEVWELVRERYDLDAYGVPDEVKPLRRHWTRGPVGTWIWWD